MARGTSTFGVLEELIELRDAGPRELIPELFEKHYIEVWFGLDPRELRTVLEAAPEAELRSHALAGYVLAVLRGDPVSLLDDAKQNGLKTDDAIGRATTSAMVILEARLRGEMQFALSQVDRLRADAPASIAFVDGSLGAASFAGVQAGLTRMLAGDLTGALAEFERVKWTDPPADLVFLIRDAHAKAALIHAVVGDPDLARRELDDAAGLPRTRSWAEPVVDATAQLAEALLEESEAASAFESLLSIPRRDIGEMWPFYVLAVAPFALAGNTGAEQLLTALEAADLPGSASGQGLPGSVIPLARAALAARAGHSALARGGLASADQQLPLTALTAAGIALDTGSPAQALALAIRIAPQTQGLRQLEIWRLSVVHLAHTALDEKVAAETAQHQMTQLSDGLVRFNLAVAGSVGDHIRATLTGEPGPSKRPMQWLTQREAEILAHIAEGLSRREIAERLFVSMNTIKTQASSLYRKLGASSRDALLGEAYDRGLI
ncbi:response regulator transcription factor [Microbacterium sp.]|uniref:helix-turn-helix transcriptional regulator n=1 Tax=Microbacterium sp. TaxID=51671 RepID=UPI003F99D44E